MLLRVWHVSYGGECNSCSRKVERRVTTVSEALVVRRVWLYHRKLRVSSKPIISPCNMVRAVPRSIQGVLEMCFHKSVSRLCLVTGVCFAMPLSPFADFQITETTKITGGSIVSMMKFAGALSKEARQAADPVTSTVMVKGNRKVHINPDSTEIIDLDKETVTRIDHRKKQYSIVTFQQMKQELESASSEAQKNRPQPPASTQPPPQGNQPEMTFKVDVRTQALPSRSRV